MIVRGREDSLPGPVAFWYGLPCRKWWRGFVNACEFAYLSENPVAYDAYWVEGTWKEQACFILLRRGGEVWKPRTERTPRP